MVESFLASVTPCPQERRAGERYYKEGNCRYVEAAGEAKAVNEVAHYRREDTPSLYTAQVIHAKYGGAVFFMCMSYEISFRNRPAHIAGETDEYQHYDNTRRRLADIQQVDGGAG